MEHLPARQFSSRHDDRRGTNVISSSEWLAALYPFSPGPASRRSRAIRSVANA
jgi:hypothetical protein